MHKSLHLPVRGIQSLYLPYINLLFLPFLLLLFSFNVSSAQSSLAAELVSYQTFGEGLMVTKAKIPPVSGLVSNFFFFNRADEPWNNNEWYEYDWEIRGAHPYNGWSQIRVRPGPGELLDSPRNSAATINIGNSMLHWILVRKGNDYIYDIRKDFDINTYDYNNAAAHGGNSISLLVGGPRIFIAGQEGDVAAIPSGKRLDFSLGVTAFDNDWSGPLPTGAYSADFVIDFTRFYGFSGDNLNTNPQWHDEFDFLDYGKWQIANWTFADTRFTQNNIRFEDGKMILTADRNNGSGGNSNENLALNGTASQSSTASGGSASRAIDNNTNGDWTNGSITHTTDETNAWWQVDLRTNADLDRIEIFNRTNCCSDRLSDFSVSVLDGNDNVVWTRFYANPPSPSLNINLDAIGRKVRVNLDGILSLAEVRVFGTGGEPDDTENPDDGQTVEMGETVTESCDGGTSITYGNGTITMSGGSFYQVLDANWQEVFNCGWQCGNSQTATNLPAGDYRVFIKDNAYQAICEKIITLGAGSNDGGSDPIEEEMEEEETDNGGGTTGESVSCGGNTLITYGDGIIRMEGGSFYQIFDVNWQEVFNCGWQCGDSQTASNLPAGDYRVFIKDNGYQNLCEQVITLSTGGTSGGSDPVEEEEETAEEMEEETDNGGETTGTDMTCGDVAVTYGNGAVNFIGLPNTAYFFKVNDLNNGWANVGSCSYNCGNEFTADNLSNGRYLLTVYNDNWSVHCETEITMTGSSVTQNATDRQTPHLSFAAFPANRTIDLQWLSNSGFKVHNFEVEHSADGVNFEQLTQFINKDWSTEMAYHQTTDATPLMGDNYYRIKEIYIDGSFAYTDVQQVNFQIDLDKVSVFPNPAIDELFLNLTPHIGKKVSLTLANHLGKQLIQQDITSVSTDLISMNTTQIQNGLYYLIIKVNGQRSLTKKVLIHRLY